MTRCSPNSPLGLRRERALEETNIGGIRHNVEFFLEILADEAFRAGDLHTAFLDDWAKRRQAKQPWFPEIGQAVAAAAAKNGQGKSAPTPASSLGSRWKEYHQ